MCFFKCEGERFKELGRTKPNKSAFSNINIWFVAVLVLCSNSAVEPITCNDQVRILKGLVIGDILVEQQIDPFLKAAVLQDIEQSFSTYTAKPMAARATDFTFDTHLNIVPMVKGGKNFLGAFCICFL